MQEHQKKAIDAWKGQARDRDISNGYWAGYHESLQTLVGIANDEAKRDE